MDLSGREEPAQYAGGHGAVRKDRGDVGGAPAAQLGCGRQPGALGGVADASDPVDVHLGDAELRQLYAGLFDALTVEDVNDPYP
ncbi:hypothetical protein [Streptomyces sp. NPDC050485]|uniref:hypothetical protein n=1 Tax=Streptomyces sp. NPDC050485 TaxID=3365617 RepID=UPI0037ACADA8